MMSDTSKPDRLQLVAERYRELKMQILEREGGNAHCGRHE